MPKPAPHRVAVLLCPQHSLASIGLVLDVLRMANHLPGAPYFELLRISESGQAVAHEDGLLSVDGGPECLAQMDLVVIPSLWMAGPAAVAGSPRLIQALRELPERVLVASLCSGVYLLAASGRLNQRPATTHWMLADGLQARYPRVQVQAACNLTQSGNLICSGGSLAGVDACLQAVERLCGRKIAEDLARLLVTDLRHGPQSAYMPSPGWRRHVDGEIQAIQAYLAEHFAETLSLEALAAQIHVSVRTLQRRFLAACGMTPMQYQQALRIERSKDLLENSRLPVEAIAEQVGYQDRVAFGRLFKRLTGLTPAAYRQRQGWGHHAGTNRDSTA